jgi:hypothetical protein
VIHLTTLKHWITLLLVAFFVSGCAYYRVVPVRQLIITKVPVEKKTYYAIAKNNVVIPEFVIDSDGYYPTSAEEAWKRFQTRRRDLEPLIDQKYAIPKSGPYQTERIVVMIGLLAVSPVAFPVMYLSDVTFAKQKSLPKKTFREEWHQYFALTASEPLFQEPRLKNEFKVIDIPQ